MTSNQGVDYVSLELITTAGRRSTIGRTLVSVSR